MFIGLQLGLQQGCTLGLHFGVAVGLHRVAGVAGVARFLGLFGKLCFLNAKNCSKRLFKLNNKEIIRND